MIVPCIDVQEGQAVQLVGGKDRALELGNPTAWAPDFADFEWLHLIDLDAAMEVGNNAELLAPILGSRKCRVGGGIRSLQSAKRWIDLGAAQVIIGTAAFTEDGIDAEFLGSLAEELGRERICVALDTRHRKIQIKGWQASLELDPEQVLAALEPFAATVLCTVVDREGRMEGTDLDWLRRLRSAWDSTFVAAGGISTLDEVDRLLSMDIQVALGMALYTGKLPMEELRNRELGSRFFTKSVWASQAYFPGGRPASEGWIDLSGNENPIPPPREIQEAIITASKRVNRYPDPVASELREAWSENLGISLHQMVIGNGSDEMIHLLGLATLMNGDNIVVGDPTFSRYEAAAVLNGAETRRVQLTEDFRHDLAAMVRAVDSRTKLVFIANPHNPTGTILSGLEVEAFLDQVPSSTLVVLDEAYIDFVAPDRPIASAASLLPQRKNVVGLRTLSKAYGLAGLRIGAIYGPSWLVEGILRIREPFSVNGVAQAAGIAALRNQEWLESVSIRCREMAQAMSREARHAGFRFAESEAFFCYLDCGERIEAVLQQLDEQRIRVRRGSGWGEPSTIRIGVPSPESFDEVMERLRIAFTSSP